ncbi:MAG: hypothetical protein WCT37_03510 [Patescibacteria group bacterium]|jgi:hypothetical protein
MKKLNFLTVSLLMVSLMLTALPVLAEGQNFFGGESNTAAGTLGGNLDDVAGKIGFQTGQDTTTGNPLAYAVARGLMVFFSVIGIIFLILTVYAGFRWMTAGGNEEQVTEAKDLIRNAVIGLGIIVFSFAITYFVGRSLAMAGTAGYPF